MYPPFLPIFFQENDHPPLPPTPQFWQVENSHGQSFEKEEFTDLF